jgi:hypothetical protein
MTSTALIEPPAPPSADTPTSCRPNSQAPTLGQMVRAILPAICIPFVEGPPVLLVAAPPVLFGLLLVGPFVVLVTVVLFTVVALVAAAGLVALAGAIVASPYLLIRHVREHRRVHTHIGAPAGQLVALEPRHSAA